MKTALPFCRGFPARSRCDLRPVLPRACQPRPFANSTRRWNSSSIRKSSGLESNANPSNGPFWTTGRALILAALASSAAYALASSRETPPLKINAAGQQLQFGSMQDFEKVGDLLSPCFSLLSGSREYFRLLRSSEPN